MEILWPFLLEAAVAAGFSDAFTNFYLSVDWATVQNFCAGKLHHLITSYQLDFIIQGFISIFVSFCNRSHFLWVIYCTQPNPNFVCVYLILQVGMEGSYNYSFLSSLAYYTIHYSRFNNFFPGFCGFDKGYRGCLQCNFCYIG